MKRFLVAAVAAGGILLSVVPRAEAAIIITGTEVGSDVVFSYSGTIDLAGLTFTGTANPGARIGPSFGFFSSPGPGFARFGGPDPIIGSASDFGPGGNSPFGFTDGNQFAIAVAGLPFLGEIGVPLSSLPANPFTDPSASAGLTTLIEGSLTLTNTSFAALGVDVPLAFIWTLPSGDTVRLQGAASEPSAVPVPATLPLFATALLGGLLAPGRRREMDCDR